MSPDSPHPSRQRRAMRFMVMLSCLLSGTALLTVAVKWNDLDTTQQRQTEGRNIAIDVLCGGLSGVEDAGKKALRGQLTGQDGQGLPEKAIVDYNRTISEAVLNQAGVGAEDLILADGSLDCNALVKVARAIPRTH